MPRISQKDLMFIPSSFEIIAMQLAGKTIDIDKVCWLRTQHWYVGKVELLHTDGRINETGDYVDSVHALRPAILLNPNFNDYSPQIQTIEIGEYAGEKLKWERICEIHDMPVMFLHGDLGNHHFNRDLNNNAYQKSDIRKTLNDLQRIIFKEEDINKIISVKVIDDEIIPETDRRIRNVMKLNERKTSEERSLSQKISDAEKSYKLGNHDAGVFLIFLSKNNLYSKRSNDIDFFKFGNTFENLDYMILQLKNSNSVWAKEISEISRKIEIQNTRTP